MLAKWLASPENPYFATNLANIVWAHFFGIGHRRAGRRRPRQQPGRRTPSCSTSWASGSPSTSTTSRQLVRDICNSRTYQRSTAAERENASDERNFAHANLRRIRAESAARLHQRR